MQLNRLSFDLKTSQASKSLHRLPLDQVVYPDKFNFRNRESVLKLRKFVEGKRANIAILEHCLKQYTGFQGSDIGLGNALDIALTFVTQQGSNVAKA